MNSDQRSVVGSQASLALALFACVFAVYIFTYSRVLDVRADEGTMFAVTESTVKFGGFAINQADHLQYMHAAAIGLDEARYSKYGVGQSLAAIPLYVIGMRVPALGLVDVVLLLNPIASALAVVFVMLSALELGVSRGRALVVALIYAFATTAWVYAKNFYNEPLTALGLAMACWGVARLTQRAQMSGAVIAGSGIALAMLVRPSSAIVVPVLLFVIWRYGDARNKRLWIAALAPMLFALAVSGGYNFARFGNPFHVGYSDEYFNVAPWVGALGMLFAPGRSLFIYAPIMLAAIPGLLFLRPVSMRVWLIGASLTILLLHSAWWAWYGGWAWGPRYIVPTLPLLTLGLCSILGWRRWSDVLVGLLGALSALMQLPGVLVYRTFFFWQVMSVFPNKNPDEVSLYTFDFFMPLANLREALRGNLDLAWKAGVDTPLDAMGLSLAMIGVMIGIIGLLAAWHGKRARVWLCTALVIGVTILTLAYYQTQDDQSLRALMQTVEVHVPANAIMLFSDTTAPTNQKLWNVNRSARHFVGVPVDVGQMQLHTLPVVRRALQTNQPVWYLQTESEPRAELVTELRALDLCEIVFPTRGDARLMRWDNCGQ